MAEESVLVDQQAVRDIIQSKNINTFFQPVVSIPTKSIVGFEAFSRGGGGDVCVIDPSMLFHNDLTPDLKIDIDRLCREKALEQFTPIYTNHKNMLLFLNMNTDILQHIDMSSEVFTRQVASSPINPTSIAIEYTLCNCALEHVELYSEYFQNSGFKTSLDNCSVDDAFNPIITKLQPDFVKINSTFFAEDHRKPYSAKLLEGLIEVADNVGAIVIAQGVETEEESIRLLNAGVEVQQGYYYTKDETAKTQDPAKMFFQKIVTTHDKYKVVKREMVKRKKARFNHAFQAVNSICSKMANLPENRFDDTCKALVHNTSETLSMFILDHSGTQLTTRHHVKPTTGKSASPTFLGTVIGSDHSTHDYVMYLDIGYEKYVTRPFISKYTGVDACIISRPFYNNEGQRYIVCIELPYPG